MKPLSVCPPAMYCKYRVIYSSRVIKVHSQWPVGESEHDPPPPLQNMYSVYFFVYPVYYICPYFVSPSYSGRNSDPESFSRLSSPLPATRTVRAFILSLQGFGTIFPRRLVSEYLKIANVSFSAAVNIPPSRHVLTTSSRLETP